MKKFVLCLGFLLSGVAFASSTEVKITDSEKPTRVVDVSELSLDSNGLLIEDFNSVPCTRKTNDGLIIRTEAGCWLCGDKAAARRCERKLDELESALGFL